MSANHQFAFAVHIMTTLAYIGAEGATSDTLAKSICTNPVVVRRILSQLRKDGLIYCQSGKSGGCRLQRAPEDITLHDIYLSIETGGPFVIPKKPELKTCVVSCHMKEILEEICAETQAAIATRLKGITLADLLKTVQQVA